MEKKPVVAIAVAIVLLVILLTQFPVVYPYDPNATVQVINQDFFGGTTPQIPPLGYFGANTTNLSNFAPTEKANVTIEGYASSSVTGNLIEGQMIAITIYPATAKTITNKTGFFAFDALYAGTGTFAFKIPNYKTVYKTLTLTPLVVWANLSFSVATNYKVHGVIDSSSGQALSGAIFHAVGFFYDAETVTSTGGAFSLIMYNDTYAITIGYPGYNPTPAPRFLVVKGNDLTGLVFVVSPLVNNFSVSGHVFDTSKVPISNTHVFDSANTKSTYSTNTGAYNITVTRGVNVLSFYHPGYATNYTFLNIIGNITNFNVTLHIANPFGGNNNSLNGTNYTVNGTSLQNWLGNNSSTVNYSRSGNYLLEGRVSTTATGNRVVYLSEVNISFYLSVNGSFFGKTVKTNSTGWYALGLGYQGVYKFLISTYLTYPLKTANITINSPVTVYNVDLFARSGSIIQLNGSIQNSLLNRNVQNSTIDFRGPSNGTETVSGTYYSSNGTISLYLIIGNYTLVASGPGYERNYTYISASELKLNNFITFHIVPVLIPSTGFSKISSSNTEGIQGLTPAQLAGNISSDSMTYNYDTLNLSIQFQYNSASLASQWFGLYIGTDGLYYFKAVQTDSSGLYYLHLGFSGKFSILAESQRYQGVGVRNLSVTSNSTLTINLAERQVFSVSLFLRNSVSNSPVPVQTLNLTNSAVPINFTISFMSNSTNYSYSLPNGIYNFSYSNPGYEMSNFTFTINGNGKQVYVAIVPKQILVFGNSTFEWGFNISSTGSLQGSDLVSPGIHYWTENGSTGAYTLTDWIYYNGSKVVVNTTTFSLSSNSLNRSVYLNISSSSLLFGLKTLVFDNTNKTANATYTVNFGTGFFYSLIFNADISSFDLYINGIHIAVGSFGPTTLNGYSATIINLSKPMQISSSESLSLLIRNGLGISDVQALNITTFYVVSNVKVVI